MRSTHASSGWFGSLLGVLAGVLLGAVFGFLLGNVYVNTFLPAAGLDALGPIFLGAILGAVFGGIAGFFAGRSFMQRRSSLLAIGGLVILILLGLILVGRAADQLGW